MHGHWDSNLNFYPTDYPLAWNRRYVSCKQAIAGPKVDLRSTAERAEKMPAHYKKLGIKGVQMYYDDGLPRETL